MIRLAPVGHRGSKLSNIYQVALDQAQLAPWWRHFQTSPQGCTKHKQHGPNYWSLFVSRLRGDKDITHISVMSFFRLMLLYNMPLKAFVNFLEIFGSNN